MKRRYREDRSPQGSRGHFHLRHIAFPRRQVFASRTPSLIEGFFYVTASVSNLHGESVSVNLVQSLGEDGGKAEFNLRLRGPQRKGRRGTGGGSKQWRQQTHRISQGDLDNEKEVPTVLDKIQTIKKFDRGHGQEKGKTERRGGYENWKQRWEIGG